MPSSVTTVFPFHPVRWLPPGIDASVGRMFEESGVIDAVSASDVLGLDGLRPRQLGQSVPGTSPDNTSRHDPAVALAVAAAMHPKLGVVYGGVPAARYGPAELMRTMLSLASLTEGKATCWLGVGERYNLEHFGYRRAGGLGRYEDILRLTRLLWDRDAPFDFDGNVWKFENAFLGSERGHRPQFWSLGAGPRFLDIAATFADGWMTAVPFAAPTPEAYAERVADVRERVERAGRDPDAFGFGIMPMCMIHDADEARRAALQNPQIRLLAALWGRLPASLWREEGIEPVFRDGWDYSVHWDATKVSDAELADILSRVSDEMVARSFFVGSPQVVTDQVKAYVEAGATLVSPIDVLGSKSYNYGDTEPAAHQWTPETLRWRIDMCRQLKEMGSR